MTRFVATVIFNLDADTPIEAVRQIRQRRMFETLVGKAETIGQIFNEAPSIMDGDAHTREQFGWMGVLMVKEHD